MDIRLTFSDMGTVASTVIPPLVLQAHWGRFSIELRSGTWCRFDQHRTNHRHRHIGYHELCLVTAGTGVYRHGRERLDLGRGLAFRAMPGVAHEITSPSGNLELVFVSLRIGAIADLPQTEDYPEAALAAFLASARLAAPALHLLPLLGAFAVHGHEVARTWAAGEVLRTLTVGLLATLATTPARAPAPVPETDDVVERACRFIDRHLAEAPDVAAIAAHVGIGERQLRRLFAARLQHSIVHEHSRRRLNAAAQHLLMGHGAAATAVACGFASAAVFTRAFKARYGMPPSTYRRQHAQTEVTMIEHTPP